MRWFLIGLLVAAIMPRHIIGYSHVNFLAKSAAGAGNYAPQGARVGGRNHYVNAFV